MKKRSVLTLALVLCLFCTILPPAHGAEERVTPTPPSWCPEDEYAVFEGSAAYEPENWAAILEGRAAVEAGYAEEPSLYALTLSFTLTQLSMA